jgi:succinate dehydrogenase / fumarate reductase, membrane anchor subunit
MMIELLTSKYPGMRIWLSQRLTAVVMAVYSVLLIIALLIVRPNDYAAWTVFASGLLFRISTFLFFICFSIHAWVGVRDVLRDYIFNQVLRGYMQMLVDLLLIVYVIWLSIILWTL